jgi:8-oxo-dGTP pyrophosphatase MutT (NUDIX family)
MPRDAATLILFKKQEDGLRVLMGLRNAGHKFLPNRMVFPGGAVDPEDFHAAVASPLPGHALARLERSASPELAAALAHAAAPPELAGLDYLCRAVTPEMAPIRFDARFFAAPASLASGGIAGSGELEGVDWYALEALLKLKVPHVTRQVLLQLQLWLELDETARASRKVPVFRYPNWHEE